MEINIINIKNSKNVIIYHFLVESKPHERIDILITATKREYLPDKKRKKSIPIVMKTYFSEGKLM